MGRNNGKFLLLLTRALLLTAGCRGGLSAEIDADNDDCHVLQGTTTYK